MKHTEIRQHYSYDCGAACLASVAAFYGKRHSLAQIRILCGCTPDGITLQGIIDGAAKIGLTARAYKSAAKDISPLMEIQAPVVAHIKDSFGELHYITIYGTGKDKVKVMDPAKGEMENLPLKEFEKQWTGYIITFVPNAVSGKREADLSPFTNHLLALFKSHLKEISLSFAGSVICTLAGLGTTFLLQQLIDEIIPQQSIPAMAAVGILAFALMTLSLYIGYCTTEYLIRCSLKIETSLISQYICKIMELPAGFFGSYRAGDITARKDDIRNIRSFITDGSIGILTSAVTATSAFAIMFVYNTRLALYMAFSLPLYYILYRISLSITRKYSRETAYANSAFESQMLETIACSTTARHYGASGFITGKMENALVSLMGKLQRGANAVNLFHTTVQGISKLLVCIILTAGSAAIFKGEMTIGELVGFYSLCTFFTMPINSLIESGESISRASVSFDRVFEILHLPPEESAGNGLHTNGAIGDICITGLSYRFPGRQELFNGLNLTVRKGEITLVKGESGCGKSTLAQLLMREFEPDKGKISINGTDIRLIDLKQWREMAGYVPQAPVMLNTSILENITLGKETPDTGRILEICRSLGLDNLVERSSQGLLTIVGDNGNMLSGGECQRICIARAIYKDPQIFILDEITSALDSASEKYVLETLCSLREKGKTILFISHKDGGLSIADNVVTIK